MFTQARTDWEAYLRVDPSGDWAAEAKKHLRTVEERIGRSGLYEHQSPTPAVFLAADSRERKNRIPAEDYLDAAITEWMQAAFPERGSPDSQAQAALRQLAAYQIRQRSDRWLMDVLNTKWNSLKVRAADALGRSISADLRGDFATGKRELGTVFNSLRDSTFGPLQARAEAEQIYLLHRESHERDCAISSAELVQRAASLDYNWIAAFAEEEQAACLGATEDASRARVIIREAIGRAERATYPELALRGYGFAASIETVAGDEDLAWRLNLAGLEKWWAGWHRPMRAYQFYMDLCLASLDSGDPHLALALAREAELEATAANHEGARRFSVIERANAALAAGALTEAKESFTEAAELAKRIQGKPDAPLYQAEVSLGLAQLALLEHRASQANQELTAISETIAKADNVPLAVSYFRTLGETAEANHNARSAERAFRILIAISDAGLARVGADRQRLLWLREAERGERALAEMLLRRGDAQDAMAVMEWYRGGSAQFRRSLDSAQASPSESWQPAFPEKTLLPLLLAQRGVTLSFNVFGDRVAILVSNNGHIRTAWAGLAPDELRIIMSRYTARCSDPSSNLSDVAADRERLHTALLTPIERFLPPAGPLRIEADDFLWTLPWETLFVKDAAFPTRPSYEISMFPGLEYVPQSISSEPLQESRALLIAPVPARTESAPALPDAREEVKWIATRFRRPTVLLGQDVTEENVKRDVRASELFHFAGHSMIRAGQSVLAVPAVNGDLVALNLQCADLKRCRLAVLSACSTIGATSEQVMGPDSLVRPFLACGVPFVIASRWPVDSAVTSRFMREYYSALFAGANPPAALTRAASRFRADPATARPYYWAAFTAFATGTTSTALQ